MIKESAYFGIAGIIMGVAIFVKTSEIIPALIPTIIGIALIIFSKEEDKIEGRKDKK